MLNYFVYKNGKGNFWSPLTEAQLNLAGESVLYVGFDDQWRDGCTSGLLEPRPTQLKGVEQPGDMNYILFVSHERNRNSFLLLTFEKTELRFWRVVGEVRNATELELAAAAKIEGRPRDYDRYFPDPKIPHASKSAQLRVLPVRSVAKVPRTELYTSINSLAVYQSLNRRTCHPLWRTKGPPGANLTNIVPQDVVKGCDHGETPFAAFARLYLNGLLHRYCPADAPPECLGNGGMDIALARSLVYATLNPILVETAALAFVRDLGLTPDIGVGKGIDVVDVRGRAAANDGTLDQGVAARALDQLKALPNTDLSVTLRKKLLEMGTLDIQCKAADRDAIVPGVLYFGYKVPGTAGQDSLLLSSLDTLLVSGSWPELDRFLAMQARILGGAWRF